MDNKQTTATANAEETVTVCGYIHDVSPIKTARNDPKSKYFNAKLQTGRDQYHEAVIFSPEKHGTFTLAATKESPVELTNVKRQLNLNTENYTIKCNHLTKINDAQLPFNYSPQKQNTGLTIKTIKDMGIRQKTACLGPVEKVTGGTSPTASRQPVWALSKKLQVPTLSARVCKVDSTSETVNTKNGNRKVKNCYLTDDTETIKLALWGSQIDLVQSDKYYNFTDLYTKEFLGEKHLTTTQSTVITALPTPVIDLNLPSSSAIDNTTLLHLTAPLESAKVKVRRECPKCLTAQSNFNPKQAFHRCNECEFRRKSEKYTTKCHGVLAFLINNEEVNLKIANSLLRKITQEKGNISHMDEQDIEEMLIKCGTFDVTYTPDLYITSIQQPYTASPEHENLSTSTESTVAPSAETNEELQSPSSTQKRKNYTDCSTPPKKPKDEEIPASPSTPTEDMTLDDSAKLFDM